MDDELVRNCTRWQEAEQAGREDEADVAFRSVFAAVPGVEPSRAFTAATLQAVTAAAERDLVRARRTRRAVFVTAALSAVVGLYFGAGLLVSLGTSAALGLFDLLVGAVVTTASAADRGTDVWSVFSALGRAFAAFIADPKVTMVLLVIQGIAAAALFALHRLLGTDVESFK